jgi:hypothetical protein
MDMKNYGEIMKPQGTEQMERFDIEQHQICSEALTSVYIGQ